MLIILGKANILNLMRESSRYQFWIKASRRWWEFDIQGDIEWVHKKQGEAQ